MAQALEDLDEKYRTIAFEIELHGDNLPNNTVLETYKDCDLVRLSNFLQENNRYKILGLFLDKRLDNLNTQELENLDIAKILNVEVLPQNLLQNDNIGKILDLISKDKFAEEIKTINYDRLCGVYLRISNLRRPYILETLRSRCKMHLEEIKENGNLTRNYMCTFMRNIPSELKTYVREICSNLIPREQLFEEKTPNNLFSNINFFDESKDTYEHIKNIKQKYENEFMKEMRSFLHNNDRKVTELMTEFRSSQETLSKIEDLISYIFDLMKKKEKV